MPQWENYLNDHAAAYQEELLDFLRIPSVSALPDHAEDVRRAGQWVERRLAEAGVEGVRMLETGGHPVIYGEWLHAAGKPTLLIYGHFDTQPADPLALWHSPPFEPVIQDGRVYARGASDDKGNMLVPILAVEAMLKAEGALPVNLKFLFEGQEEIGSPQLPAFLAAHRELFACDLVISADGGQHGEDQPSIGVACKGLSGVQIDVKGAGADLHSGVFGGAVANPIHALVHLLDSMHSPEGKILVEGFYDTVVPLTDADRAHIAAVPFDEAAYAASLGVASLVGEPGYSPAEQLGARPTLEVNGIWGGFQGAGTKTVLPSEAHAKITCRLVPDQDPAAIADLLAAHVQRHLTPGVTATVSRLPGQAKPYAIPADHWGNQAAAQVLEEVYGKQPYYTRTGGSIPVCELFQEHLGAYTVSYGFGLMDEQIHAPNEFYRLASFARGRVAYGKLLTHLGAR